MGQHTSHVTNPQVAGGLRTARPEPRRSRPTTTTGAPE